MAIAIRSTPSPAYLFKIGQDVACKAPFGSARLGRCTVTRLLPHLGDDLQYRIRSENETFERVVVEHQLTDWMSMDA